MFLCFNKKYNIKNITFRLPQLRLRELYWDQLAPV